jgi:hypothetical protein
MRTYPSVDDTGGSSYYESKANPMPIDGEISIDVAKVMLLNERRSRPYEPEAERDSPIDR